MAQWGRSEAVIVPKIAAASCPPCQVTASCPYESCTKCSKWRKIIILQWSECLSDGDKITKRNWDLSHTAHCAELCGRKVLNRFVRKGRKERKSCEGLRWDQRVRAGGLPETYLRNICPLPPSPTSPSYHFPNVFVMLAIVFILAKKFSHSGYLYLKKLCYLLHHFIHYFFLQAKKRFGG